MAVLSETIAAVKSAIRVTSITMDDEIEDIIAACKMDLIMSGIINVEENGSLD